MSYGNESYLLVRFKYKIPSAYEGEALIVSLLEELSKTYHTLIGYQSAYSYQGSVKAIVDDKILVKTQGYVWHIDDEVIKKYFADNPTTVVRSMRMRRNVPVEFLTEEERAKQEAKRAAEKKHDDELARTTMIRAIQKLVLYKDPVRHNYVLMFQNKKIRKAFYWNQNNGRWQKRTLPSKDRLVPCSPLEFTVQIGTTFAKTVEENFGLEIVGRDSRGEV